MAISRNMLEGALRMNAEKAAWLAALTAERDAWKARAELLQSEIEEILAEANASRARARALERMAARRGG